ncbi:MAG: LamG domain-containing protein [Spirochaetes bacterium]|nr:LamG domain-containing protein [Spirochaetota bacterium]
MTSVCFGAATNVSVPVTITNYKPAFHSSPVLVTHGDMAYGIRENRFVYGADLKRKYVTFERDLMTFVHNDISVAGERIIVSCGDGVTYALSAASGATLERWRTADRPKISMANTSAVVRTVTNVSFPGKAVSGFFHTRRGIAFLAKNGVEEALLFIKASNLALLTPAETFINGTNIFSTNVIVDAISVTWRLTNTNEKTTAYQVQLFNASNASNACFDSDKVIDGGSVCAVKVMCTNGLYFSRVRVWNEDDEPGAYSPDAQLTIAISNTNGATNTAPAVTDPKPPVNETPRDRTAPVIIVAGVSNSGYYRAGVRPQVTVTDEYLTAAVITLDGTAYEPLAPVIKDGIHTLAVYGKDRAGNESRSNIVFTVDGTAPVISITGVSNGGVYSTGVIPLIKATDAALVETIHVLDGMLFTTGTKITASGSHALAVFAIDSAGNSAEQRIEFCIDTKAPDITVSGAVDGTVYSNAVNLSAMITDENLSSYSISLDGSGIGKSCTVSMEGTHSHRIAAEDKAGNKSLTVVSFSIDRTFPVVLIDGITQNMKAMRADIRVRIYDENFSAERTVVLLGTNRLDGMLASAIDENGMSNRTLSLSVTNAGSYILSFDVSDKAGNRVTNSISFAIVKFEPVSNMTFYANYDRHPNATYARGDSNEYSSCKRIVSGGYISNCVNPGGSSPDQVQRYHSASNIVEQSGTLSLWVKPNWSTPESGSNYFFALKNAYNSALDVYSIAAYASRANTAVLTVKNKNNTVYAAQSTNLWWRSAETLSNNGWTQLLFTWDYTAAKAALFINGVKAGEVTLAGLPKYNAQWLVIGAGREYGNDHRSFNGRIDETNGLHPVNCT